MHELSIARTIVETVSNRLVEMKVSGPVRRIALRVGPLDAVVPDALRYCFEVCADDTPLEGAELAIELLTSEGLCNECGTEFVVEQPVFLCPRCHSSDILLEDGEGLTIEAISRQPLCI